MAKFPPFQRVEFVGRNFPGLFFGDVGYVTDRSCPKPAPGWTYAKFGKRELTVQESDLQPVSNTVSHVGAGFPDV